MSKHLLTISPQSNKQEYELVEGDESLPLNAESEMELETAVAVPLDERICVEQNTRFFFFFWGGGGSGRFCGMLDVYECDYISYD